MHESEKWKWSLCHVRLFATPWTAAYQAPPSMGFSRQEYWSGNFLVMSNNIAGISSADIGTVNTRHRVLWTKWHYAIEAVVVSFVKLWWWWFWWQQGIKYNLKRMSPISLRGEIYFSFPWIYIGLYWSCDLPWPMYYCSVAKLCLTLCDPMDCSTPGSSILYPLPEFAQVHAHWVGDAF